MAEEAKKAAPKRKTTARKTTATRKPAARKAAPRRTATRKAPASKVTSLQARVTEASRSAFLASLGLYGMAYDQAQERVKSVESELAARRKKADKLYAEMVKRGEKVEKQARSVIDDIEIPSLDRAQLEAQLEKAKARFEELKDSLGRKVAA